MDFNAAIENNLLNKFSKRCKIISCGDLNINLFNPYRLNSLDNFISLMIQYNFYSLISHPTKYDLNNEITEYALLDQI